MSHIYVCVTWNFSTEDTSVEPCLHINTWQRIVPIVRKQEAKQVLIFWYTAYLLRLRILDVFTAKLVPEYICPFQNAVWLLITHQTLISTCLYAFWHPLLQKCMLYTCVTGSGTGGRTSGVRQQWQTERSVCGPRRVTHHVIRPLRTCGPVRTQRVCSLSWAGTYLAVTIRSIHT